MKILVVRFKQIGDSILTGPLCYSLKKSFPDAQVDYVVYDHIAPLFEKNKYIDNVISITKEERKNTFTNGEDSEEEINKVSEETNINLLI